MYAPSSSPTRSRRRTLGVLVLAAALILPVTFSGRHVADALPATASAGPIVPEGQVLVQESGMVGYAITNVTESVGNVIQLDPVGISDAGRITGLSQNADGSRHAFVYDPGAHAYELSTDATATRATAIAPNGSIAGELVTTGATSEERYLAYFPSLADGSLGPVLPVAPSPADSGPVAVNSAGTLLLGWETVDLLGAITPLVGLDGAGTLGLARDINEAGVVVGMSAHGGPSGATAPNEPTMWTAGVPVGLGYPLPGIGATAVAVNDDGDTVVQADGSYARAYFRPATGGYVDLGDLGGQEQLVASDINNNDEIVGTLSSPGGGPRAFLWSGGRLVDLNSYLKPDSGWTLESAIGINEKGQITGDGLFHGFQQAYVIDPVNPVVFVPGAGASRISEVLDTTSPEQADEGSELWLGCTSALQRLKLSLWPEDVDVAYGPELTKAFAPIRHGTCFGVGDDRQPALNGYGTFLDDLNQYGPYREYKIDGHLERYTSAGCDTSQGLDGGPTPNLFVFAYDWRLDNAKSAVKLADFIDCVEQMWPGHKVDIVAHSMGSLVSRRYVLDHLDAPVERVITIGAPWLGAPRLVDVLQTGNFAPQPVNGPTDAIRYIVGSFLAAHQLAAGPYYPVVATQPVFRESGWDINNAKGDNEIYDFDELAAFLDEQQFPTFAPGTTAREFQTYYTGLGGQADWSTEEDLTGIDYTHIVGLQAGTNTIGTVVATNSPQCELTSVFSYTCALRPIIAQVLVCGDGTVPLVSATRIGRGHDLNTPDADIRVYRSPDAGHNQGSEHTGLTTNPEVVTDVLNLLMTHPDQDGPISDRSGLGAADQELSSCTRPAGSSQGFAAGSQAAATPVTDPAYARRYAHLIGGLDPVVADDSGSSTALPPAGDTYVEGVDIYPSNVDDASLVTLPESLAHRYTMSFTTTDKPVELELLEGTQQAPFAATRWIDAALPAGVLATLEMTPAGANALRYDSDGNGIVDTTVAPTVVVRGDDALDTEAPSVTFTAAGAGSATRYAATATDAGSGVDKVYLSTDGTHFELYTGPVQVDPSTTELYAFAQDRAGNRSDFATVQVADVVHTPLTTAVLNPVPNSTGWNQQSTTVDLTAVAADGSDAISSIVWSADGAMQQADTTVAGRTATVEVPAAGVTTVTFHAVGVDGAVEPTRTIQVRVDLADPSATISSPAVNSVVGDLARVAGTATDEASGISSVAVELRNSNGDWWSGTAWVDTAHWLNARGTVNWTLDSGLPHASDLSSGAYRIRVRTTDGSGRTVTSAAQTATVSPDLKRRVTALVEPAGTMGNTSATAINDRGLIVGVSAIAGISVTGVGWHQGTAAVLTLPPGMEYSGPTAITGDGSVLGGTWTSSINSAVTWTPDGRPTVLPALPNARTTEARAGSGTTIVGVSGDRPVRWDGNVITALQVSAGATGSANGVNASGLIVGSVSRNGVTTAATWTGTTMSGIGTLGGSTSGANAVNDLGEVVGWSTDQFGRRQAFLFQNGEMTSIHDYFNSATSEAVDINDLGQVVGTIKLSNGANRAFTWTPAFGMVDLNTFLPANSGWVLQSAKGINNLGQIVGFGTLNGVGRGFVMSALHAPIAEDGTAETAAGAAVDVALVGWDPDVIDSVSVGIVDQPLHGTLSGTGTAVVYTPKPGFSGEDTFTFRANDGMFDSNIGTVTVTVTGAPHPDPDPDPVPVPDPATAAIAGPDTADEGESIGLTASSAHFPAGSDVTYSWDLDADGAFDDATGAAAQVVGADDGTITVAVRASDAAGATATATHRVDVRNVAPTVAGLPATLTAIAGVAWTASGRIGDAGADTFTATVDYGDAAGPVGLPLSGSEIQVGHTYKSAGTFVVTLTVCDDDGGCARSTVTVTVSQPAPVPSKSPLMVSTKNDRSSAKVLDGSVLAGTVYGFIDLTNPAVSAQGAISKVDFLIDGVPFSIERDPAYDLARTRTDGRAYGLDTTLLTNGTHTVVATITYAKAGSQPTVAKAIVRVDNAALSRSILVSTRADRGSAVRLDGASIQGKVAIFLGPTAPIEGGTVRFSIDGKVVSTEEAVAYDLATTAADGSARFFDLKTLKKGSHTVTAEILLPSGVSITQSATFTVV